MNHSAFKPGVNIKWVGAAVGLLFVCIFLFFNIAIFGGFPTDSLHLLRVNGSNSVQDQYPPAIPNIVHFAHLVVPSPNVTFEFPFRQFIAIYSAWYFLRPDTIYIHTNVEEHLIEEVLNNTQNPWTRAVLDLPGLSFKHASPPNQTTSGLAITKLPNKSDFLRTRVLTEMGGIYLDDDAYVLRDLKPLRGAGFENVVGKQKGGEICPAVILSKPGNELMKTYHDLQDTVFKPWVWADHAVDLLTTLARDFHSPNDQVLILPQDAFFSYSWETNDLISIYQVHKDLGDSPYNNDIQNLTSYKKDFHLHKPKTWQTPWRSSYVLHGWTSGIKSHLDQKQRDTVFGEFKNITLEYVLAQNSNFALAVYPAVKHALDSGILDGVKNASQDLPY